MPSRLLGGKLRVGVIDVGTNSVRLLVAEVSPYRIVEKKVKITRLGEGIGKEKRLLERAIERTVRAVTEFCEEAKERGSEKIAVVGTQALREAENSSDFWQKVLEKTGVQGRTLSEEEEALFAFRGVISGLSTQAEKVLVVDIGGGSTEFIAGSREGLEYLRSFPVGSVRVSEKFLMENDPPTAEDIENAFFYLEEKLAELPLFREHLLVGVAGTVTTIAAILQEMEVYQPEKVHGFKMRKEDVERTLRFLSTLPLRERKKVKGLEPERADVIIGGTITLLTVMKKQEKEEITVSESDLLDGIALSLGEQQS